MINFVGCRKLIKYLYFVGTNKEADDTPNFWRFFMGDTKKKKKKKPSQKKVDKKTIVSKPEVVRPKL